MKTLVAIKHVDFEDLGTWESLLSTQYKITYLNVVEIDFSRLEKADIDLLVVLGGPIGVYQEQEYPFITAEITLLEKRLQLDLPTLGICLGSQLMARALGARVFPNPTKEIGWHPLKLTDAGKKSCVSFLDSEKSSMFHWHGDTFDLPKGTTLLASTAACKNQIFSFQEHALGFQCHPEVSVNGLEKWWIGHSAEISQSGLSVRNLRAESAQLAPQLQTQSREYLTSWITRINDKHVD